MINKSYVLTIISLFSSPNLFSMTTIVGDSGSASGPTITLSTGAATNANGTANFAASGSTVVLSFDDVYNNIGIGFNTLAHTPSPGNNIAIGDSAGASLISGGYNNILIGIGAGDILKTGNDNVIIGFDAGSQYEGSENTNICINDVGVTGDVETIRISSNQSGQGATSCYIGGITNVTLANPSLVTINPNTGQLGSMTVLTNVHQPAFLAYLSTTQSDVTGDGTVYTIFYDTELYDRAGNFDIYSGIFIAPVTGIYHFQAASNVSGLSVGSTATLDLVTNTQTYRLAAETLPATATPYTLAGGIAILMQANDTASVAVTVNLAGGNPTVNVEGGTSPLVTYFSGALLS